MPMREEELKNKIRESLFPDYDSTIILGDIDLAVTSTQPVPELFDREYYLWAEAKSGTTNDIYASFIQLILTIGKSHLHERHLPPRFLGAFDEGKIAFIEFHHIVRIFYKNDFNWNVTPSNHNTKEFKELYSILHDQLSSNTSLFNLKKDLKDLKKFIRANFRSGVGTQNGINITKNNFMFVFQRWVEEVKPQILVNWDDMPSTSVVNFFYADLLSRNDYTLREELAVVLRGDRYKILQQILKGGTKTFSEAFFLDGKAAYNQFWNRYLRPPRKEYIDLILERRDLLIPQDLRKFRGDFFTPPQWVQKSQEYLAAELGEEWQKEYYIWDCCAGTGNLLYGLSEPYRIWASTLDEADVQVMKERIRDKSLNLLDRHVFQFDFLNDSFNNLPQGLRNIINNPESRRKLVIYINPPYAEAANKQTVSGNGKNKTNVATSTLIYSKYRDKLKIAGRELFAQFFMRIYDEIPTSVLAQFSTLKIEQAPNFRDFREAFRAKLGRNFLVPADTFDNVSGKFPIGFFIWHLDKPELFTETVSDVYDAKDRFIGHKTLYADPKFKSINDWIITTRNRLNEKVIGYMSAKGNDFQNTNYNFIINDKRQLPHPRGTVITDKNLKEIAVYFAVRHSIEPNWLNDRDQFFWPDNKWAEDSVFQSDCLIYTLFSNYNNIQSANGVNHWIPFSEKEVGAQDCFESHFMSDYINGTTPQEWETQQLEIPTDVEMDEITLYTHFKPSIAASAVMEAGRRLWQYYHQQHNANPNASLYDIKKFFQGTKINAKGKMIMNKESNDKTYQSLIADLRHHMKNLCAAIEPKVYLYGFLK